MGLGISQAVGFDIFAKDRASAVFEGLTAHIRESRATTEQWKVGVAAASAGVAGTLIEFGKQSVEAYVESQKAQLALSNAVSKFPALADVGIEKLKELAEETGRKTRFDHNAAMQAEANLAQYHLTGTQITQLLPLVSDYAAKTGQDLPSAATLMGKALLGNARALKDIGINFKLSALHSALLSKTMVVTRGSAEQIAVAEERVRLAQEAYTAAVKKHGPHANAAEKAALALRVAHDGLARMQEKVTVKTATMSDKLTVAAVQGIPFKDLVKDLRQQVGGFAEKDAQSAATKSVMLRHSWEDLKETVGKQLVPALTTLVGIGLKATNWVSTHGTAVKIAAGLVGGFVVVGKAAEIIILLQTEGLKKLVTQTYIYRAGAVVATIAQSAWNTATTAANDLALITRTRLAAMAAQEWALRKATAASTIARGLWNGATAFGSGLLTGFKQGLQDAALKERAAAVVSKAATAARWLWTTSITVGTAAATAIGSAIEGMALKEKLAAVATKIWTAGQWLLNAALDANPIGIVIIAIAALAAGLYYAWNHSETFRRIVTQGWKDVQIGASIMWNDVIKPIFRFLVDTWLGVAGSIVHGAALAFGWVPKIGDKLKAAAKAFDGFRNDVNKSLGGLNDKHITVTASLTAGGVTASAGGGAMMVGGGRPTKGAKGGPVWGGVPGQDSVPYLLMPGEFIVRSDGSNLHDAMRHYGVRGMAKGGVVVDPHVPSGRAINSAVGGGFNHLATALGHLFLAGGAGSGGAARWATVVLNALSLLHQPGSLLGAVLRRINFESGGNPLAVNLWDSNAKAGHPSQGLMQVIMGTFLRYAGSLRGLGILNPLANIYSGLNYALHRYGSIGAIDPLVRPMGYDSGGVLRPGLSLAYNGTGKPETVRTFEQEQALGRSMPVVHVYIGNEEFKGFVRVVVRDEAGQAARKASNGRRL